MTLNFELEPGDKLEQLEKPLALSDLRLLSLSPTIGRTFFDNAQTK